MPRPVLQQCYIDACWIDLRISLNCTPAYLAAASRFRWQAQVSNASCKVDYKFLAPVLFVCVHIACFFVAAQHACLVAHHALARCCLCSAMGPLHRAFGWPQTTVTTLCDLLGVDLLSSSLLCTVRTATSFFSGLGTAELAWQAIGSAVLACGLPWNLKFAFACECDRDCQQFLAVHCSSEHVFVDISNFFKPAAAGCFSLQSTAGFRLRTTQLCAFAYCCRHGRLCTIVPGRWEVSAWINRRTVNQRVAASRSWLILFSGLRLIRARKSCN